MDEPCTKRMVPTFFVPAAGALFQRKSLTSPFLVQCSVPPVHTVVLITLPIPISRCEGRSLVSNRPATFDRHEYDSTPCRACHRVHVLHRDRAAFLSRQAH